MTAARKAIDTTSEALRNTFDNLRHYADLTANAVSRSLNAVGEGLEIINDQISPPAKFPTKPGQIKHILEKRPGKYLDNASNRALIMRAVRPENYVLTDRIGTKFYTMAHPDGTRTYVQVMQNGIIKNAGYDW